MKTEELLNFNPDVIGVYFKKLEDTFFLYSNYYFPKLGDEVKVSVEYSKFQSRNEYFDIVLTSPPYGDSRTTVAYGQFSTLSNEWLGINYARKIDGMLMGGIKPKYIITKGIIADYIAQISQIDSKRALEVSAFYNDLGNSIQHVANCIRKGGKTILYSWKQNRKKCTVTNRPVYCRKICRKWVQTFNNLRTGIE
jgi:hypothetical protein